MSLSSLVRPAVLLCGLAALVGLRAAWKWLKELFTGRAQPVAA